MPVLSTAAFSPPSNFELESAVEICLEASPEGACTNDLYGPIGDWDVSLVADMSSLFLGKASFNGDLSKWNMSRVGDMNSLFLCATSFNGHISKWDVSRVTDMNSLFDRAASYNRDLSKWDVSRVINMDNMFANAKSFNGDIAKWDVSRVTSMKSMFNDAKSFSGDVSKWDVSRVTSMQSMFYDATSFHQTLCGSVWVHSKADKPQMFSGSLGSICSTTTTTTATIYTENVIIVMIIGVMVVLVVVAAAFILFAAICRKDISSNRRPLIKPLLKTPETPNQYQRQQQSLVSAHPPAAHAVVERRGSWFGLVWSYNCTRTHTSYIERDIPTHTHTYSPTHSKLPILTLEGTVPAIVGYSYSRPS